jgi:hypothetical protein
MRMFRRRARNDYDSNYDPNYQDRGYDDRSYDGRSNDPNYTNGNDNDGYDADGRTAATPAAGIRRAYGDSPTATTARTERPMPTRTERTTTATADQALDDGRRWHHGPTRAVVTLLAAAVAGLLAWVTTNISDKSTGGYWAVYGILAGAGLVMALSQVIGGWTKRGRPTFSPTVFLVAFVPTAVAVLWIMAFHQPHMTLWRGNVTNWSGDLGITGLVRDMGRDLLPMLCFGLGLVFGFCFDTTGAMRRAAMSTATTATRRAPVDRSADEPLARDREAAREQQTTVR